MTYLTGFTGDSSCLLLTPENQILISDGRYLNQIEEECPGIEMNIRKAGILIHQQVHQGSPRTGISRLAIEADSDDRGHLHESGLRPKNSPSWPSGLSAVSSST